MTEPGSDVAEPAPGTTRPGLRQLKVVWGGLVGGVAVYTAVAYGLVTFGGLVLDALPPAIMRTIATVVMVFVGMALILRRGMVEKIPPDAPPEERRALYVRATLLPLMASEAGAMLLITAGLLAASPTWILAGGIGLAVLMFMMRPSAEEIGLVRPQRPSGTA